jgi:hypothetical protein
MPSDADVVKRLMKQNLLGVFSERDAEKRRSLIEKIGIQKAFSSTHMVVTLDIQPSTMPRSKCSVDFPILRSQSWRMKMHTVVSDVFLGASVHPASHGR